MSYSKDDREAPAESQRNTQYSQFQIKAVKKETQVDLVLAFIINLYTQQSKSYFSGYQKYQIMKERQSIRGSQNSFGHKNWKGGKRSEGRQRTGNIHETTIFCFTTWACNDTQEMRIPVGAADGPGRLRENKNLRHLD